MSHKQEVHTCIISTCNVVSQQLQLLLFKRGIHATSSARFQLLLRASGYWKDGGAQPHNSSPGPATGYLGRKYLVDTEPLKFSIGLFTYPVDSHIT